MRSEFDSYVFIFNTIDGIMLFQIEFDYLECTYIAYMRGEDSFEEYDEKLADILSKIYKH